MNNAPRKVCSLAEAISAIPDGATVAVGGHTARRHPMAAVREIIRQKKKGLALIGWNNGIDMDMLIGAGCAEGVETSYIGMGSLGLARNFRRWAESGRLRVIEHSETTALDRFRAASIGLTFFPCKTPLGNDLGKTNPHVAEIKDPFTGERWAAVQAAFPEWAVIHAHTADEFGNVQLDRDRWHDNSVDVLIGKAAKKTIVTVEQIVSHEAIRRSPIDTILHRKDVHCVVEAPWGAHPCCCDARYDYDMEHQRLYYEATATPEAFEAYLDEYVRKPADHLAYLQRIGIERLMGVTLRRKVTS